MNTKADRIINMADSSNPSRTQGFAYDNNDALTNYTIHATTQGYQYDEDGNRTAQGNGGATTNYAYASGSNRLLKLTGSQKATLQYDATGNIVADGVNRYTYDTLGRLVQVSNAAGSTRYQFDPLGQRVAKLSGSGKDGKDDGEDGSGDKRDGTRVGKGNGNEDSKSATIYFTYDTAGHLIGEYSRQRTQSTEYVWLGNSPVAMLKKNGGDPATLYTIHTDHLGTPRQVTHAETNQMVWEWSGEPFGTSTPDEDPGHTGKKFTLNLRYAGQYYDQGSNLFHNGFRDYNPKIGRYVQSDPIGLGGGINTYTYVGGNPISNVDPQGLASITIGLFTGVGAQVTIGQNPNGSGFMSLQFGWGIGGGASYNPLGQAPGYCACSGSSWTLGYGVYAQSSFRAGPVSASLGANLGRNANSCSNDLYRGVTKSASLKDVATGFSASVSGGGQFSLSGGGSAQGGCTCGG